MPRRRRRSVGKPSWRIRRRVVVLTLGFCASCIVWLLGWGADTRLNETIAQGLMILAGSVIGAYVFGAAWDDANVMKFGGDEYGGGFVDEPYDQRTLEGPAAAEPKLGE